MANVKETFQKINNSAFMIKLKAFFEKHKNIFQIIKFTFMSCIAAIVEVASLNIMLAALKGYADTEIHWFIFNYAASDGGLQAFVAFIVSTTLAQIVSYVVNRKKTFNANNNLIFSVVTYVIMEVVIICLQSWSGPLLAGVIHRAGVSAALAQNISKFIWMTLSFVFVFVMDKFVIMRNKDDKKQVEDTESADLDDEIDEFAEEIAAMTSEDEPSEEDAKTLEEHVEAINDAVSEGLESVGVVPPKFEAQNVEEDDASDVEENATAIAEAVEEGLEKAGMTAPKFEE